MTTEIDPIRSDADLDHAIAAIDRLLDRDDPSPEEFARLDALADRVHAYEAAHHPIGGVPDTDLLRHLIGARDVTQATVARETGIAESTVSGVLAGRRRLTRAQVGAVAAYFGVSPAVFF